MIFQLSMVVQPLMQPGRVFWGLVCGMLMCGTWPAQAEEPIQNTLGMKLVRIVAGEFQMGLREREDVLANHKRSAYQLEIHAGLEMPQFPVRITKDFWLGETEVTVGQFRRFVTSTGYVTDAERADAALVFCPDAEPLDRFSLIEGRHWRQPGFEQSDEHPVTCVSWNDANAFCRWLSKTEVVRYRLPSEAEWEYACRSGTSTCYSCGDDPDRVYAYANVADATLYQMFPQEVIRQRVVGLEPNQGDGFVYTAPVASRKPNPWGICDMHGNVWEWCSDKYSPGVYQEMLDDARRRGSRQNPEAILDFAVLEDTPQHQHGDWRSLRGGSWYVSPIQCRSTVRAFAEAGDAASYLGFRVVRE
ncbi:formylglycine-generating enzyme family protein [Aureliella helgolandensis]|uniref:Serine/threonine-protein kinase pkn1 n=1 Tax=Aureliella helgolandensis TaxID=2527968 RepID=A0A518GH35_9BACT|nr:formylglycine-generating enzyme family protein [Aureliella helgolandensis]QDV27894.1 Serine/threonine-protein kinase pkn1 [Aureliella helgolandensis]